MQQQQKHNQALVAVLQEYAKKKRQNKKMLSLV